MSSLKPIYHTCVLLLFGLLMITLLVTCDNKSNTDPRFEDLFVKFYGGDGNQTGVDMVATDNGFVLVGNTRKLNGNSGIFIVRTDELGNELWSNVYGNDLSIDVVDVELDNNNDVVLATTVEDNGGNKDIMFYKVSLEGLKLDSLIFGEPAFNEVANDLLITSDGDYIITGLTTNVDVSKPAYSPDTDFEDILSVRVTSSFSVLDPAQWRKVSGFSGVDRGTALVQKIDGTFLFFGTTDRIPTGSTNPPEFNMFVFPAGSNGVANSASPFQWLGNPQTREISASITPTVNQGFVLAGTAEGSNGSMNAFFATLGNNDDIINSGLITLENNISVISMIEDQLRGGFFVLGNEIVNNASEISLSKITFNGILEWNRTFGNTDDDFAGSILQLSDGSIVIIGTVRLESQTKMSLIKTNSQGLLRP
ncbi:hypothetical protein FNH22_29725 [Fulvivirga sp. M361]|uniref:hypothetical protein n=1 Tax=Fulvivirga sp. M361 TaxID=2594266 RepID=UPI0011799B26|nr:hypothetical protein [Fulvivirga sp. M361]TRX48141.1 hypothetical protein FNH22_29725 [Fulvivirga sp. M361]